MYDLNLFYMRATVVNNLLLENVMLPSPEPRGEGIPKLQGEGHGHREATETISAVA